ncbi:hypothetical protein EC991_011347 [Linnemannia zychae]|nr:hypothetical protein EC991_011347 [Linnemannia zychae]
MGIVDLDCIAATPDGAYLYGIGNAQYHDGGTSTLLYRSNENPTDANNITWVNVGEDRYSPHMTYKDLKDDFHKLQYSPWYKYPRFGNVDCTVNNSGNFTAFFYNPEYAVTRSARPVPMGIQFGQYSARPIWGSTMYGWTNDRHVHQSFHIGLDGVETVVHAVMDESASVIRFGLLDVETRLLKLAAVWKLVDGKFMVGDLTDNIPRKEHPKLDSFDDPPPSDKRHMVYANNSLYLYSDATGLISSFPFPSPYTAPTQRDSIQAPATLEGQKNTFFRGTRQGASYLGFLSRAYNSSDKFTMPTVVIITSTTLDLSQVQTPANIILSANNTITHSSTMVNSPVFGDITFLHGVGGQLPGQVPFAFGLSYDGYTGIAIGGPSVGNLTTPERAASVIPGINDPAYRNPFRSYDGREIPGSINPVDKPLELMEIVFIGIGSLFGLMLILHPLEKLRVWIRGGRLHNGVVPAAATERGEEHELDALSQGQYEDEVELPGYYDEDGDGATNGTVPLRASGDDGELGRVQVVAHS